MLAALAKIDNHGTDTAVTILTAGRLLRFLEFDEMLSPHPLNHRWDRAELHLLLTDEAKLKELFDPANGFTPANGLAGRSMKSLRTVRA